MEADRETVLVWARELETWERLYDRVLNGEFAGFAGLNGEWIRERMTAARAQLLRNLPPPPSRSLVPAIILGAPATSAKRE